MDERSDDEALLERDELEAAKETEPGSLDSHADLPVVARMVVEIRSDGSRTVARGALEDAQRKEQIAVRAEGTTPLALAASLTRALARAPFLTQALSAAPHAAGRAAGRALRTVRGLLTGPGADKG